MEEYGLPDCIRNLLTDVQTGFFFYTLAYVGLRLAKGKEKLRDFDKSAAIVICGVSIVLFAIWIADVAYSWSFSQEDRLHIQNRMTGPYAWAYWLPPVLYFLLPQFLWLLKVRENYFCRLLIAFAVFVNFERYVIIITSLHRDYLPSSWTMYPDFYPFGIFFGVLSKFVLFTGLAALLFSIRPKRDNFAP